MSQGDLLATIGAELDERLERLRPAVAEYERLLEAAAALGDGAAPAARVELAARAASGPRAGRTRGARVAAGVVAGADADGRAPERRSAGGSRAPRGAAQQAIVAALEHGSHTVGELTVVTAMSGPNIRQSLRRLLGAGTVTRAKRDGRAAYALSSTAAD